MTHDDSAAAAAATYFDSWLAKDFARLRSVLADDVNSSARSGRSRAARSACAASKGCPRS